MTSEMEWIPPSYEAATARDAWTIIAGYIPSSDLCAVSLVCRRWHELFMPFLWGDPASHFGTQNDAVYVALTRFRRTLKYARLEVRMLTHTLHMPPALSEIYGGPRPGWLKEILDYLPCLQALMVSQLPFFDHNAMMALRPPSNSAQDDDLRCCRRTYNVRLLLAEREPNTTSHGLAEALQHFPLLVYLDLSFTKPARSHAVLSVLSHLEHLQLLKLRGIGLRDSDVDLLADAIGLRVRFLDLTGNSLTDAALDSLLHASFLPAEHRSDTSVATRNEGLIATTTLSAVQADVLSRPHLDRQFLNVFTRSLTGRSFVENLPHVGITHLYVADNEITVDGVTKLLASKRLHALDVGTVKIHQKNHEDTESCVSTRGAEIWIPTLASCAKDRLTYFRGHHAVVTVDAPVDNTVSDTKFLPELPDEMAHMEHETSHPPELQATRGVHELPVSAAERFELADTSIDHGEGGSFSSRPDQNCRKATATVDGNCARTRQRSAFPSDSADGSTVVDVENIGALRGMEQIRAPPLTEASPSTDSELPEVASQCNSPFGPGDPRSRKISELLSKRPKNHALPLRNHTGSSFPHLHPSQLPHLETLVLTDVPSHVPRDSPVLASLKRFITACSNEALLATLQAGSDYSLPPGRARIEAERQRARSLFGLRRLVLEITPITQVNGRARLSSWKPSLNGALASATGDRDSENLWSAAMHDFSFFGGEECGVPDNDPSKYIPLAWLNEKVSLTPDDDDSIRLTEPVAARRGTENTLGSRQNSVTPISPPHPKRDVSPGDSSEPPMVDLIAELAAFRRQKKAEYEKLVQPKRYGCNTWGSTGVPSTSASLVSPVSPTSPASFEPFERFEIGPSVLGNHPKSPASPPISTVTLRQSSFSPQPTMPLHVEGHWKGEVKIVRNAASKGRSGMVDMYGNYFENGYVYP